METQRLYPQADILIIGGGASGLAAAIAAKQKNSAAVVCILERNPRVGKKILATGNGRCNLGNNRKNMTAYYGSLTELLPRIWEETQDAETFFQGMGLYCRQESEGRLYPHANQGTAVLDALRLCAEKLGVLMYCDSLVESVTPSEADFLVETADCRYRAKTVLVTTGGYAAPKTGSDGSAFRWLQSLGHHCTETKPALVAFYTDPEGVRTLKGIRIPAKVTAWSKAGKALATETGEVQFTDRTLSGICVMNLSARCTEIEPAELSLNLFPEYDSEQIEALLWELYAVRTDWKREDWLTGLFPKKVGLGLLQAAGIKGAPDRPVYEITAPELHQLALVCQAWRFPITHRGSWQEAQVTSGGIPLDAVDDELQSRLIPGLYFAGEVLDLHGDCGGYNLNWAWRSGQYAGVKATLQLICRKGTSES